VLMTPLLFHPNFGVFPLDEIAYIGVSPSRNLNLYQRSRKDGHRQTDGQTIYCGITTLCVASRDFGRVARVP